MANSGPQIGVPIVVKLSDFTGKPDVVLMAERAVATQAASRRTGVSEEALGMGDIEREALTLTERSGNIRLRREMARYKVEEAQQILSEALPKVAKKQVEIATGTLTDEKGEQVRVSPQTMVQAQGSILDRAGMARQTKHVREERRLDGDTLRAMVESCQRQGIAAPVDIPMEVMK